MKKQFENITFFFLMIGVAIVFYFFTSLYPICSDDFGYKYICKTSMLIESIQDVFLSQFRHVMEVNGRFVVHSCVQGFLTVDKFWFNIANSVVYASFAVIVANFSVGKRCLYASIIVMLTYWCLMPNSGSTIFWLTGSFNYLWASCLTVVFLYCLLSSNKRCNGCALFLALFAGNSHEAISLCLSISLVLYTCIIKKKNKKYIYALILYVFGCLSNILAPGTLLRFSAAGGSHNESFISSIVTYCLSFYKFVVAHIFSFSDLGLQICLVLFFILLVNLIRKRLHKNYTKDDILVACLLIGALANVGICIVSKTIYPRGMFGFCFLTYLSSCLVFLPRIVVCTNVWSRVVVCIIFALICIEGRNAYKTIRAYRERMEYVELLARNGERLIRDVNEEALSHSRYIESYGISGNELANSVAARYYNSDGFAVLPSCIYDAVLHVKDRLNTLKQNEWIVIDEKFVIFCADRKPTALHIDSERKPIVKKFEHLIPNVLKKLYVRKTPVTPYVFCVDGKYYVAWHEIGRSCSLYIKYGSDQVRVRIR